MTANNPKDQGRRDVLKGALSIGGLTAGMATTSSFLFPALAQGERLIPFTDDASEAFSWRPIEPNTTHWQDTREITSFFTNNEDFYLVQHYGQPEVDNDSYRLRVTGLVDNELELSLDDLQTGDDGWTEWISLPKDFHLLIFAEVVW